jgi:hypothetical protein
MAHYIQVLGETSVGIWLIDEGGARRIDATGVSIPPSAAMLSVLQQVYPATQFVPLKLTPGEYYPRMARPNNAHFHESPGTNPANAEMRVVIETGRGQLSALRSQLEEAAVECLVSRIEGRKREAGSYIFMPELVVRRSTARVVEEKKTGSKHQRE